MPTLLHVGCGPLRKADTTAGFAGAEWDEVRLDVDPTVEPDIVGSMTDMSAVAEGSVDAIFSSHNIEHLHLFEIPAALREFRRVLRPAGFLVITCPDLESVAARIAEGGLTETLYESDAGAITPFDILYGHRGAMGRGNLYMAHNSGFSAKLLGELLRDHGFPGVVVRRRAAFYDLWAAATPAPADPVRLRALAAAHFPSQGPAT